MTLYISLFLLAWWVLSVCLFFFIPRLLFPFLFFFVFLQLHKRRKQTRARRNFPYSPSRTNRRHLAGCWCLFVTSEATGSRSSKTRYRFDKFYTNYTTTTQSNYSLSLFLSAVAISMSTHKTTFSTNASKGLDVRRRHIGIDGPWNKMPVPTHPVKKIELDR